MITKEDLVRQYSNPEKVYENALKYFNKDVYLYFSTKANKKYMIYDPNNNKYVHFGQMIPPMEDYTKHQDKERRKRYLQRAKNIKGDWKNNLYSPNQLAINLLWN